MNKKPDETDINFIPFRYERLEPKLVAEPRDFKTRLRALVESRIKGKPLNEIPRDFTFYLKKIRDVPVVQYKVSIDPEYYDILKKIKKIKYDPKMFLWDLEISEQNFNYDFD